MRLAIDLFCGLGGWTDGLLAAGHRVVGFDIEQHEAPAHETGRDNKGFGGSWFHNAETGRTNPNRSPTAGGMVTGGVMRYPAQLVIQDVLTLHGSQFKDAAVILASPPCQNYSYLAMPWSRSKPTGECVRCRGTGLNPPGKSMEAICLDCDGSGVIENSKAAKALRKKWETEGPDNRLFDACFRIQREAIEATPCGNCGHHRLDHDAQYGCGACQKAEVCGRFRGRHIPLIVENVRGAQPWVGKAKANYGSFYLWGDVEQVGDRLFVGGVQFGAGLKVPKRLPAKRAMDDLKYGVRKLLHEHLPVGNGPLGRNDGTEIKNVGGSWFNVAHNTESGHGRNPVNGMTPAARAELGQKANPDGTNHPQGSWFRIADSSQGDRGIKTPGRSLSKGAANKFGPHNMGSAEKIAAELGTKIGGDWFSDPNSTCRKHGSKSNARKQASALIAKIPLPLSRYVGEAFA